MISWPVTEIKEGWEGLGGQEWGGLEKIPNHINFLFFYWFMYILVISIRVKRNSSSIALKMTRYNV